MSSNRDGTAIGPTRRLRFGLAGLALVLGAALSAACGGGGSPDRQVSSGDGSASPFQGDGPTPGVDPRHGVDPDEDPGESNGRNPSSDPSPSPTTDPGNGPPTSVGPQQAGAGEATEPLPGNLSASPYVVPSKSDDGGATPSQSDSTKARTTRSPDSNNRMQRPPDTTLALAPHFGGGEGLIPAELILRLLQKATLVEVSLGTGWYAALDGPTVVHWTPYEDHLALVARHVDALEDEPTVLATSRVATPPAVRGGVVVVALDPVFDPANGNIASDAALELYKLSTDGSTAPQRLTFNRSAELSPALSPDADRVAYAGQVDGDDFEILVTGAGGGKVMAVTSNDWNDLFPSWSPDGTHLAFASDKDGDFEIYAAKAAVGATAIQLTANSTDEMAPSWSTAGVVFSSLRGDDYDLLRISGATGIATALTGDESHDLFAVSSLDATAVAFSRVP